MCLARSNVLCRLIYVRFGFDSYCPLSILTAVRIAYGILPYCCHFTDVAAAA
jgi:hypothetical protein